MFPDFTMKLNAFKSLHEVSSKHSVFIRLKIQKKEKWLGLNYMILKKHSAINIHIREINSKLRQMQICNLEGCRY